MDVVTLVRDVEGAIAMKGEPGRDTAGVEELGGDAVRGKPHDGTAQPVHEIEVAVPVERRSLGGVVARDQDGHRSTHDL